MQLQFSGRTLWFPMNMDFRGRVYPAPPILNHIGDDVSRSLLVFARKQPLGPHGLDWLKVHCVNLTGFLKRYVLGFFAFVWACVG